MRSEASECGAGASDTVRGRCGTVGRRSVLRGFVQVGGGWRSSATTHAVAAPAADLDFYEAHREFIDRIYGGQHVQIELEALDPAVLRELYETAVARWWDEATYQAHLAREVSEREQVAEWVRGLPPLSP